MRLTPRPIGECIEKVRQVSQASKQPDEDFLYIDLSSIEKEEKQIIAEAVQQLTWTDAPSRARQIVHAGDILVSTVRPNLNGVAQVDTEYDGAIASTGYCVLRVKPDLLDSRYLFHWVCSPGFVEEMVRQATGASYPAVSDRIIQESTIPLPGDVNEQHRIATTLDKANAIRKKRREALKLDDEFLRSVFLDMFGDPVTNPNGLTKQPLGDLVKLKSGNFLPSHEMAASGEVPVYGGNGINGYHDQHMFNKRQVVIGRVGAYCGVVHVTETSSWVTDNALYVAEMTDRLRLDYLAYALKFARLNQYSSQSGQPLVSGSRLYPVEILVPSLSEQVKFESIIRKTEQMAAKQKAARDEAEQLFLSLQQQAFAA
jgi:type I restriction enzyme S subunit